MTRSSYLSVVHVKSQEPFPTRSNQGEAFFVRVRVTLGSPDNKDKGMQGNVLQQKAFWCVVRLVIYHSRAKRKSPWTRLREWEQCVRACLSIRRQEAK